MPQIDLYLLGRSPSFVLPAHQEQRTDLSLVENTAPSNGHVRGTVTSGGSPVEGATVKLMTNAGAPFDHTVTNAAGNYIFNDVPPGDYTIVATKTGYLVPTTRAFTLLANQTIVIDFSLTLDTVVRNVIYGIVTDTATGLPIEGANVGLITAATLEGYASTPTNASGQFVIYAVVDGTYLITAEKEGYALPPLAEITVSGGVIARSDILLTPTNVPDATVNGFVTSQAGTPLSGAAVGLYGLAGTTETLLQITFTDSRGLYLFGQVSAGTYLIKAKVEGIGTLPTATVKVA